MELTIRPWENLISWRCIRLPSIKNFITSLDFFRDNYLVLVLMSTFYNYVIYEFLDVMFLNLIINVLITICMVVVHACLYDRSQLEDNDGYGIESDRSDQNQSSNNASTSTLPDFQNHINNRSSSEQNGRKAENFTTSLKPLSNQNNPRCNNFKIRGDAICDCDDSDCSDDASEHQNQYIKKNCANRNKRRIEHFTKNNNRYRKFSSSNHNYLAFRNRPQKRKKNRQNSMSNYDNYPVNSQMNVGKSDITNQERMPRHHSKREEKKLNVNWGVIILTLIFCWVAYQKNNEVSMLLEAASFNSSTINS